jgi:hypothetical protein
MQLPESLYLEYLRQASVAIASPPTPDGYERYGVVPPLEGTPDERARLVGVTMLYAIPGETSPILRKTHFRSPDIPEVAGNEICTHIAEEIKNPMLGVNNDMARMVVEEVTAARQEIEQRSSLLIPFHTIAALGIYNTTKDSPFAFSYISSSFIDSLLKHMPIAPGVEEIPEELLQEIYAREAEQIPATAPYPEWRETMLQEAATYNPATNRRDNGNALISWLLLPHADTHPVLNARLFE